MERFADALDRLSYTPARNAKLALLMQNISAPPPIPTAAGALAALTDGLFASLPLRRALSELMAIRIDPVLYQMSRDYVGDTAETVSLLWPEPAVRAPAPTLNEVVSTVSERGRNALAPVMADFLDRLDRERTLGAAEAARRRACASGVSARLAKIALAEMSGRDVAEIEEVWHALAPPYTDLFAWLEGKASGRVTRATRSSAR